MYEKLKIENKFLHIALLCVKQSFLSKTLIILKNIFIFDENPWSLVVMKDRTYFYNRYNGSEYLEHRFSPDKIEVISGLEFSDKIVSTGLSNLSEGSKIQIIE